jgi:hypothetical protein
MFTGGDCATAFPPSPLKAASTPPNIIAKTRKFMSLGAMIRSWYRKRWCPDVYHDYPYRVDEVVQYGAFGGSDGGFGH